MRPFGVTLCAWFQFVRAALVASLALGVFFVGGMASRLASLAAEGNTIQSFLSGFGRFLSMALLIYAAILLTLGFGLLFSQGWARTLTIIFAAMGFLILLPRVFHHHPFSILFALLNLAVLIYLLLPDTRAYFDGKSARGITPA